MSGAVAGDGSFGYDTARASRRDALCWWTPDNSQGRNMAITDLLLAILHHFLVFSLAGVLAAELVLVRPGLGGANLSLLGRIDGAYGGLAIAVIVVGVCRVLFGLKGWEYYVSNHAFWGKIFAFAIVGLLSVRPTRRILAWRKSAAAAVPDSEILAVRAWIKGEIAFLAAVLVFAAAMARGIGT
jgi:putative membrane protein